MVCEILIVLTVLRVDGTPTAVLAHPVAPKQCRAVSFRFRVKPPDRYTYCPILRS